MISAEVVKAVEETLVGRGIEQREREPLPEYVARGLDMSARQATVFLEALNRGRGVDEALREAEVEAPEDGAAVSLARSLGAALGRLVRRA